MESYLTIAERILKGARRPLGAREILDRAYLEGIVPQHLYGRTQHKTLQARLSEDILLRRERSLFFRTEPGRFFLREFLTDTSLPEGHRTPIVARRRERDLQRGRTLSVSLEDLSSSDALFPVLPACSVLTLLRSNRFHYHPSEAERTKTDMLVWSFVVVSRGNKVLSYRIGRYRDGRDTFLQRRSIGFFTAVSDEDCTLFDQRDFGIMSSGVHAAAIDLDIPEGVMDEEEYRNRSHLHCFFIHGEASTGLELIALVSFDCPEWFEPTKRRLAINDLQWLDIQAPRNHVEDFDPWSQIALAQIDKTPTEPEPAYALESSSTSAQKRHYTSSSFWRTQIRITRRMAYKDFASSTEAESYSEIHTLSGKFLSGFSTTRGPKSAAGH